MAVVVTPVGVRCDLQRRYCYEDPQRDCGRTNSKCHRFSAEVDVFGGLRYIWPQFFPIEQTPFEIEGLVYGR